jgi:hypothetical protein
VEIDESIEHTMNVFHEAEAFIFMFLHTLKIALNAGQGRRKIAVDSGLT